ncbi:hypothetical protein [Bacillus toyonensis]|uniref:hypothetical protein n=1 Tax=Bacillus toyonensis TaxID=155322 RepID=UPI00027BEAB2|nr:hypothetical protein [Bacillus toyonensis]EJV41786.1 hypothetical protein IEA_05671 [Bacillus toyonensis]
MKESTKIQLESELEYVESSIKQHELHLVGLKDELKKTTLNIHTLNMHRTNVKKSLGHREDK